MPVLRSEHLIPIQKVGIRVQLYDRTSGTLMQGIRLEQGPANIHLLNVISPAFTASFALADLIPDQSLLSLN